METSEVFKDPLLLNQEQSSPLTASSTQHSWEMFAWNPHGRSSTVGEGTVDPIILEYRPSNYVLLYKRVLA